MITYKDTIELEVTYENAVQAVLASRIRYAGYVNRVGLPDRTAIEKWWNLCYGILGENMVSTYLRETLHIPTVSLDHLRSDEYARMDLNVAPGRPLHDQEIDLLMFPDFNCRTGVGQCSLDTAVSVKLSTCPPEDENKRSVFISRRDFKVLHLIKRGEPNDILEDIRSGYLIQGIYTTEVRNWHHYMSERITEILTRPVDRYTAESLVEASKIMDIGKLCLIGFTTREGFVAYNEALPKEQRLYTMFGKTFWTAKIADLARPMSEFTNAVYGQTKVSTA